MNESDIQAALEAVEAGDTKTLEPLLKANPALVHQTLEHDGNSVMLRPTLLHRTNARVDRSRRPRRKNKGHLEAAQMLIDYGADINSTVDGCLPPLEMALWSGNLELIELLLANGADVECYTEAPPVEVAVLARCGKETLERLIEAGAQYDISHTLRLGLMKETRALLEADPSLANTETAHGLPLNLAMSKPGSTRVGAGVFKLLLRHGADIHAEDRFGLTPLKAARLPENDKVVQSLLEMGVEDDIYGAMVARDEAKAEAILQADPTQAHPVAAWPQRGPVPPIIWAIWSGSTRLVELALLQNVVLDIHPSPLELAIGYQCDEMVRLLLDHGASPECDDCSSWPGVRTGIRWDRVEGGGPAPAEPPVSVPLYVALRGGTINAVEMLLEAGANPNSMLTKWSGLQWNARGGDLRRVKILMDHGADLASPCAHSALRLAVRNCSNTMIEMLVTHGVDIDETDEDGRTVLDVVGQVDSRPPPEERAETVALLEDLIALGQRPKRERARALRLRAQLIDSVTDGRIGALRKVEKAAPELFERELVRKELMHYAAGAAHGEVVALLVEQGAPMTIRAATVLGRLEVVTTMLDEDPSLLEGDQPPRVIDEKKHLPWREEPPLIVAARKNHLEIVRLLLDREADINRRVGWYQNTALHVAVASHSTETVGLLLARGADVTIRTRDHHLPTPLQKNWPPTVSREKIRDLLIAHGAKPEEQLPHEG